MYHKVQSKKKTHKKFRILSMGISDGEVKVMIKELLQSFGLVVLIRQRIIMLIGIQVSRLGRRSSLNLGS